MWRTSMETATSITHFSTLARAKRRSGIFPGSAFIGSAFGPSIASGYELTGTADFNGGGSPDFVLYNPSTRRTAICPT